jgi:hypothetical protein
MGRRTRRRTKRRTMTRRNIRRKTMTRKSMKRKTMKRKSMKRKTMKRKSMKQRGGVIGLDKGGIGQTAWCMGDKNLGEYSTLSQGVFSATNNKHKIANLHTILTSTTNRLSNVVKNFKIFYEDLKYGQISKQAWKVVTTKKDFRGQPIKVGQTAYENPLCDCVCFEGKIYQEGGLPNFLFELSSQDPPDTNDNEIKEISWTRDVGVPDEFFRDNLKFNMISFILGKIKGTGKEAEKKMSEKKAKWSTENYGALGAAVNTTKQGIGSTLRTTVGTSVAGAGPNKMSDDGFQNNPLYLPPHADVVAQWYGRQQAQNPELFPTSFPGSIGGPRHPNLPETDPSINNDPNSKLQ